MRLILPAAPAQFARPGLDALQGYFPARQGIRPGAAGFSDRFAFELDWLSGLASITQQTARILAARTACAAIGSDAPPLLVDRPDQGTTSAAGALLGADLGAASLGHLDRAWLCALPPEQLLAAGGDERLALSGAAGVNRYGCTPWPRPHVISFGSCTASSLSAPAFAAVERRRRQLLADSLRLGCEQAIEAATDAAERAILGYFDVADLACAVLTASGTDAALTVTALLAAEHPDMALTSVLVSPSETGSGVPLAVQGRHFAGMAPDGRDVGKGEMMAGLARAPALTTITLRERDGRPRAAHIVAQACEDAILAATADAGGRAVLHAIDGSKTGLTAPDRPALLRLRKRFGARLDVVIDACQARIEPALVRWYLSHGFPVLVTGSKFFAAPGFCGAVLFPGARLRRIGASARLPQGLACYARLQGGFGSRRCLGLLLRWEAALHDMAGFADLPPEEIGRRLDELGVATERALASDQRLALVPAPRPPGMGWSDRRSVFTFKVASAGGWCDPAALRRLYLALQEQGGLQEGRDAGQEAICQLGQPVELGDPLLGGLRIAFSAAQVGAWRQSISLLPIMLHRLAGLLDQAMPAADSSRAAVLVRN